MKTTQKCSFHGCRDVKFFEENTVTDGQDVKRDTLNKDDITYFLQKSVISGSGTKFF
jgi:hypothetical protein